MFFFVFFLFTVFAHNWLNPWGPRTRCRGACYAIPMPPKNIIGDKRQAHVQVGQGQEFVMEWTTGHPGTTACVIVFHASAAPKAHAHSRGLCAKYLDQAPADAFKWTEPRFQRLHWSCSHAQGADGFKAGKYADCPSKTYNPGVDEFPHILARVVPETDELYITRERGWNDPKWTDDQLSPKTLFQYTEQQLKWDRRAEYTNPEWPWIEAVHMFKVTAPPGHGTREWDTARFTITGKQGPGQYMVHSMWGGYRDAMDIDLFPSDTVDVYGKYLEEKWVKTEHCQIPVYSIEKRLGCHFFEADAPNAQEVINQCIAECTERGKHRCDSVNVVPVIQPDGVAHQDMTPNVPWEVTNPQWSRCWKKPGCNWFEREYPWDFMHKTCKPENHPTFTKKTMVCYGMFARTPWIEDRAWNQEVERFHYVRKDPEDPIFYSTCYRPEMEATFSEENGVCEACESEALPKAQPEWEFGDMCIPCPFYERSKNAANDEILLWPTMKNNCIKCA